MDFYGQDKAVPSKLDVISVSMFENVNEYAERATWYVTVGAGTIVGSIVIVAVEHGSETVTMKSSVPIFVYSIPVYFAVNLKLCGPKNEPSFLAAGYVRVI